MQWRANGACATGAPLHKTFTSVFVNVFCIGLSYKGIVLLSSFNEAVLELLLFKYKSLLHMATVLNAS